MQHQHFTRAMCMTVALTMLLSIVSHAVWAESRRLRPKRLAFDVAENGSRFVFDEAPVDANGFPYIGTIKVDSFGPCARWMTIIWSAMQHGRLIGIGVRSMDTSV